MLINLLSLSAALELTALTAAEICDQAVGAGQLEASLDAGIPFSRKSLCEFLGIGESTLSGWLKDGRVPRMAKNAIALLAAQKVLAAEVRRLSDKDLRIVRAGDHYQVCELAEDDDGEIDGRVIADRIASIQDARLLASGRRALRVLERAQDCGVFEYAYDMSENAPFLDGVRAAEAELESHALFVTDHAKWQTQFGKKARTRLLDDASSAEKPQ